MKIFKDIFTDDELASDVYPVEVEDDVILRFTTKLITRTEGNYDMAGDGGGEESYDPTSVTVNNLVDAHKLVQTDFDKKSYMTHIKDYMARLLKKLEADGAASRVPAFKKGAQSFVKKVIAEFSEYTFYQGEKCDIDNGMIVLSRWSEDGQTPYFYMWKDGLVEQKY
jgi:hypothetical protein